MAKIYYEANGAELTEIMSSPKMEQAEANIMMQKKSEVEAAFLQRFGVPGAFRFSVVRSAPHKYWNKSWHGGRVIYRILPDDKRTRAILRAHLGWINQFL